jgi:outer membrane protein
MKAGKEFEVYPLKKIIIAGVLCAAPVGGALADDVALPWIVHVGAHVVDPQSNTGDLAGLASGTTRSMRPSVSLEYLLSPSWRIEALAALPFEHDVRLDGQRAVGVKQLPPVIGVNYHFLAGQKVSPFLGVGLNYTHFFDAKGHNALQGANVDLKDSWGVAWHGGVDVALDERWTFTVDARWIDIDSKVKVGGASVGTAHIDPWVYGVSVGYRF